MIQVTQQDISTLKSQGYTDQQIQQAIKEVKAEERMYYNQAVQKANDPRTQSQRSSFETAPDENMIKWQLELNDILEKAEHILRGDKPVFQDGQVIWQKNPEPEKNPLNEYGVQKVMRILSMYINRNTILSDYEQDEINYKVFDFGREINDLFFKKYEEMGMDTDEKRKEYPMLIREIVDVVHSAYKRALLGGERESLRTARHVTQSTQNPTYPTQMVMPQTQQTRGLLNPMRYVMGKYK